MGQIYSNHSALMQVTPRFLEQKLRVLFENLGYNLTEMRSVHTCLNNFLYSRHAVSTVNFLLNMLHSLAP